MDSIILGIIQGIAEFLPISSSAHLLIYSEFISNKKLSMGFNVGLHLGTSLAIVSYFYKDWVRDISEFKNQVLNKKLFDSMLIRLLVATLPAALVGLLFDDKIEELFHGNFIVIAIALIVVGVILVAVDRKVQSKQEISQLNFSRILCVGFFQVVALIPGVSRSGITIIGGRLVGLNRNAAAKFSFLLGTPVMLGASILKSRDILGLMSQWDFVVGFLVSGFVGLLAIHYFLLFVKRLGFEIFAVYRIILALFLIYSAMNH